MKRMILLLAAAIAAGPPPRIAWRHRHFDQARHAGADVRVVAMIGMVAEGQKLKFDAVNAAGGVKMGDGKTRQVEFVIMDDANEPPRTVTNARRMAEQNRVFAFVGSVGTPNQAIKAYTSQNKIPNIFIYSGIYEWGDDKQNPWGIGMVPSFTTEAAIYARHLQEHKPDAKVAMLYLNTDFGQNFLEGFKAAIKDTKVQLVAQSNANTDPTVDTQLTNLKASAPIRWSSRPPARPPRNRSASPPRSGWKPTLFVTYAASSVISLKAAGLENSKGVLTGQFVAGRVAGVRQRSRREAVRRRLRALRRASTATTRSPRWAT